MKLYEIVIRAKIDYSWFKTMLVMSSEPLTIDSEAVKKMASVDEEWCEYVAEVHEKRVYVSASGDQEASDIFGVLRLFGQ